MRYANTKRVRGDVARLARPPKRVTVAESVMGRMRLSSGSGVSQIWDHTLTPYMVRPMELLTSRLYDSVVFVGPARTGKTAALLAWVHYTIENDPADMMVLHMTQTTASDFSKADLRRLLRDNDHLKPFLSHRKQDDNTFDKHFPAGNVLYVAWPTASQGSGKTIARVAMTDYDRMPMDIDKRGTPYDIFSKRTQTLMSRGMTYVETSPDFEVLDPTWQPKTAHEAPPTLGALALYNNGTRERLYYKCPHCGEWFITPKDQSGFTYRHNRDESGITITDKYGPVHLICSANGCLIEQSHKRDLNNSAIWVPDGCAIKNDELVGRPPDSKIASFWMHGCSAAYQRWESIVERLLQAERTFDTTGSEEALKTRTNVDFGAPYLSRAKSVSSNPKDIEQRAEDVIKRHVPSGVRYLIASIDVQKGHFVVQVVGHGIGNERWLIDRYKIQQSERKNESGEYMAISPGSYIEDWSMLTEKVVNKTYPLMDGSGRAMKIKLVMCDSGGMDATTANAYDYWRNNRRTGISAQFNRHNNAIIKGSFVLLKGERNKRFQNDVGDLKFPDSTYFNRKFSNARGDVPVWLLNVNKLKDVLTGDIDRNQPGPRYIHFPDWLPSTFYEEITSEVRDKSGRWIPLKPGARNESLDLLVYDLAGNSIIGGDRIDWDNPPAWAEEFEKNSLVLQADHKAHEHVDQRQETQPMPRQPRMRGNNQKRRLIR